MWRSYLIAIACLFGLMLAAHAAQIQMLPPTDFNEEPCNGSTSGILQWDGSTSIKCVPKTVGLPNGNIGIGTTNPLAQLTVGPGSLALPVAPVQISTGGSGTAAYYGANLNGGVGILFGYDNGFVWRGGVIRSRTSDPLHIVVNDSNESMTILNNGRVGIGTDSPQGNLDIENNPIMNEANTATLCLNGSCVQHIPAEVYVSVVTLQSFNSGCTGGPSTITADGAFTAWCTSACNRYCASLGYKGGLINEYDGNTEAAACGCF